MQRLQFLVILTFAFLTTIQAQDGKSVIGKEAPRFRLPNKNSIEAKPIVLADEFKSENRHAVVLSFFATWCTPCRKELPFLQHMADSLSNDGLRLFAICLDSAYVEPQKKMIKELGLTCPIIHDKYGILVKRYKCGNALPYTVFINRSGFISNTSVGFNSTKKSVIRKEISKILG